MIWLHRLAWLVGGAIFANAVPHLVAGVMGQSFRTPFATPPGRGLSSPRINVVWAFANLAITWLLLTMVGDFNLRDVSAVGPAGAGALLASLHLARRRA